MTVASEVTTRREEVGNGTKVVFEFPFKVFSTADIAVYKVTTATQAQTLQVLDTDYTVEINGTDNDLTTPGGSITYTTAPVATETSLILANYPLSQNNNLTTASDFPEATIEGSYDKVALINNVFSEEIGRTAKVPVGSSISDLKTDLPSAGKMIVWNSDGTALKNTDVSVQDFVDGDIPLYNEVAEDQVDNTPSSSSAFDFQALPNMADSITPKSTANGVLILVTMTVGPELTESPIYYRVKRGSEILHNSSASNAGNRTRVTGAIECQTNNSTFNRTLMFGFIDEPATVSATTYSVEVAVNRGSAATWYTNRQRFDSNASSGLRTSSNISLIELKNVL